ncbi:SusE domain-containing protein [Fodinibius salsisoli]|uniref:SusE domain-containing protein n=1 Tax=Fodinibius salsisoli TaxID=2820877 RepID=A0ABT3PTC0_9BACT|nr:SusE domain-containing protein [Fodinibius salsisoli]MCW9709111.1 SusE domain-containing protein [Fodinibius salsisoli]
MKKLRTPFIVLLSLFTIVACDKEEMGPVISSEPGSPAITAPESGQGYTLTEETAEDTLMTITWTEPDYGFAAPVTYSIEMGLTNGDFADSTEIGTTTESSYALTVSGMNNRLISAGFAANQQITVPVRVRAMVNDSVQQEISEPASYTFTPYLVEVEYPEIYVPGGYQAASGYMTDWEPADAPALYSFEDDDFYEGYVYIANAGAAFKFTAERNWNNGDWGDTGADGTLDAGGDNIIAETAGYYKMDVDLSNLTYSLTNTDWGVIGDATAGEWDADQDMTYNPDTKVWTITTDLTAGEMKFRANDAWDLNYGDAEGDGTLEAGADNIAVEEAGNYTVELNLSEVPYTYSLTQN